METKTVNKMMEENGQVMRWGWWDGETNLLSLFQPFFRVIQERGKWERKLTFVESLNLLVITLNVSYMSSSSTTLTSR